jgi:hypothetical protein
MVLVGMIVRMGMVLISIFVLMPVVMMIVFIMLVLLFYREILRNENRLRAERNSALRTIS